MPGRMPALDDRLRIGRRRDEEGNLMLVDWQFSRRGKMGRVLGNVFLYGESFSGSILLNAIVVDEASGWARVEYIPTSN